jgi:hypothetical protein
MGLVYHGRALVYFSTPGSVKRFELRNLCCGDLAELRLELRLAAARLRHKGSVVRGCITQCGYAV